jgi:hypothetical protein
MQKLAAFRVIDPIDEHVKIIVFPVDTSTAGVIPDITKKLNEFYAGVGFICLVDDIEKSDDSQHFLS